VRSRKHGASHAAKDQHERSHELGEIFFHGDIPPADGEGISRCVPAKRKKMRTTVRR
jgi:hypothetical protein